jgi:hypothetical protein
MIGGGSGHSFANPKEFLMRHTRFTQYAVLSGMLVGGLMIGVGCQRPATVDSDHGHSHAEHDHAHTYAEAITEIKELRETVQNAFAAGTGADADGSLHEIGHLLEDLPRLARDAGLDRDQVIAVRETSDRVFDAYGELDTAIHSGEEIPDGIYEGVAETIDSGISELEAKLAMIGAEPEGEQHDEADHDEADHDHAEEEHSDAP